MRFLNAVFAYCFRLGRFVGLFLGALSVLGGNAFAQFQNPETRGFDVNDVSILFPMTKQLSSPFYPDLRPLSKNLKNGQPLISESLFGEVAIHFRKATGGNVDQPFMAPNFNPSGIVQFHVVNFRYDPCFPAASDAQKGCVQQIRLVIQAFEPTSKSVTSKNILKGLDYSMHLLYELGEGLPKESDPVLQDLLALKVLTEKTGLSNAGKALTISPALDAEMKKQKNASTGPISQALKNLILSHISEENLKQITVVNGSASDDQTGTWNFVGGNVLNGHWVIQDIPRLPGPSQLQTTDFTGSIANFKASLHEDKIFEKNQNIPSPTITDQDSAKAAVPGSSNLVTRLNNLELLQNPQKSHPKNVDCASCHLSTNSEVYLRNLNPTSRTLGLEGSYSVPVGITGFADPKTLPVFDDSTLFGNVHVVGYFDGPLVAPIVAHSAALVAETLNRILNLKAPTSLNCDLAVVKACFLDPNENANHCLSACLSH